MTEHDKTSPQRRHPFTSVVASLAFAALMLSACSPRRISESVTELNELIRLDIPVRSATWEVFYMPEAGGLPAPTDYIILVAEAEPRDASWFANRPAHWTKAYAMPEAARDWMSEPLRAQVHKLTRQSQEQTMPGNRKDLQAKMTQSGRPVPGFACTVGAKLLVYVTLQDNTGASTSDTPE